MGATTNTSPEPSERERTSTSRGQLKKAQDSMNGSVSHKTTPLSCFGISAVADDIAEPEYRMQVRYTS
jgi:hypothetical protein